MIFLSRTLLRNIYTESLWFLLLNYDANFERCHAGNRRKHKKMPEQVTLVYSQQQLNQRLTLLELVNTLPRQATNLDHIAQKAHPSTRAQNYLYIMPSKAKVQYGARCFRIIKVSDVLASIPLSSSP